MRYVLLILMVMFVGCGPAPVASEQTERAESMALTPPAGAPPVAPDEVPEPVNACPPHPDPYYQACLQCPPPSHLCAQTGCSMVGPLCVEVQRAPGNWCVSGVGTCDTTGVCVLPAGDCLAAPAWDEGKVCCSSLECDDGNPCTEDQCNGHCFHQPVAGSPSCGAGRVCKQGACCSP